MLRVGHASVKVYRNVQRQLKGGGDYWLYVVAWVSPEGRRRQKFKDVDAAMKEARLKVEHLAAGRVEGASMTTGDRDELAAARSVAGDVPLLSALREWKRIQELAKGQGIAAAELWAQHNQSTLKRIKVAGSTYLLPTESSEGATMKLTTTTVKVCSTELNDSRSKESVTDACREAPPESTTEVRTGQPQRR